MQKNKYLGFIVIALLFLTSCSDTGIISNFDEKGQENSKVVLTPEEFVSIAYDNPKELNDEEISYIISDFRQKIKEGKGNATRNSVMPKISIKKKYYINENNEDIVTISSTRSPKSEKLNIPIFEVELSEHDGGKSMVFVCGDERIPEVFFYVENYHPNFEMDNGTRYLLELSKKNIISDIQQVEHIKATKRDSTLYKIAQELNIPKKGLSYRTVKDQITTTDEISTRNNNPGNPANGQDRPTYKVVGYVNPLSKVEWAQDDPYNYSMPIMTVFDGHAGEHEGHIPVGCANIAIGTLFTIIKPNMILGNNLRVNWDYVESVKEIRYSSEFPGNNSPKDLVDMISGLLAQIATATESYPIYEERKIIDVYTGSTYMKSVITQTGTNTINTINYIRNMANFSGDQNYQFNGNQAKQSLFERKPVFLLGSGHYLNEDGSIKGDAGGHAWLIDGVVIAKHPRRSGYDHYWSVNMGWGLGSRSYFRTSNDLQYCDVVFKTTGNEIIAYYTQEMNMLYNISRK